MPFSNHLNTIRDGLTGWIVGLAVLIISLLVVPPSFGLVNVFEPGKQLAWVVFLAILTVQACRGKTKGSRWVLHAGTLLLLWMVGRTFARPMPFREVSVLASWLLPLCLFLIVIRLRLRDGDHEVLGRLLLAAGGLQSAIMLLQRIGLDPFFVATTSAFSYLPARMIGTIGYQNQAAEFLVLSLAGLFLLRRLNLSACVLSLLVLLAVFLTANRSSILGLMAASLAVFLTLTLTQRLTFRKWRRIGFVCVIGLLLIVVFKTETVLRFREVILSPGRSVAVVSRMWMARIGFDMIGERPLIGWGAGEYAYQYLERIGGLLPETMTNRLLESVVYAREAHNDAVQFGAEFGLFALVCVIVGLCLLLVVAVRRLILDKASMQLADERQPVSGASSTVSALPLGIIFIIIFMAVSSSFSFTWQTSVAGPLAGLLMGWMAGSWLQSDEPDIRFSPFSMGIVTVCTLGLLLFQTRSFLLDWRFTKAVAHADLDRAGRLIGPYDYRQQALLGAAFAKAGPLEQAATLLTASLVGFQDVLTFNNLGHVFASQQRWSEALPIYMKWERTGIRYDEALWNLAITYEHLGDLEKSAELRLRKHTLFPERSRNDELMQTVVLLFRSGDLGRALKLLETFERRCEERKSGWTAEWENLAGAILMRSEQFDAAEARFRQALIMNPSLKTAKRNLENLNKIKFSPPASQLSSD